MTTRRSFLRNLVAAIVLAPAEALPAPSISDARIDELVEQMVDRAAQEWRERVREERIRMSQHTILSSSRPVYLELPDPFAPLFKFVDGRYVRVPTAFDDR